MRLNRREGFETNLMKIHLRRNIHIHEAKRDYQESKVANQVVKWFDKQAFPMFIMRRKPFLKKFGFHFWIPVIQTYFK